MALVSKAVRLTGDVLEMIEELKVGKESPNKTLKRILSEGLPNPALAAIEYALDAEKHDYDASNQVAFLNCWNEGEFDIIRDEWDDVPDEVFIGADSLFEPED